MTVGFCNGCFDLFHDGHRHFLTECANNCTQLWVLINSDDSVNRLKGVGRPFDLLEARAANVGAWLKTKAIDSITTTFGSERELDTYLRMVRPDVLFKGAEYKANEVQCPEGTRIHWIGRIPGYSTTNEIEKRNGLRSGK